jgi:hypothetical protein
MIIPAKLRCKPFIYQQRARYRKFLSTRPGGLAEINIVGPDSSGVAEASSLGVRGPTLFTLFLVAGSLLLRYQSPSCILISSLAIVRGSQGGLNVIETSTSLTPGRSMTAFSI